MTYADKVLNPRFGSNAEESRIQIRINLEITIPILDHFSILFTVAEKGNLGDVLPFLVSHADFYETRRND